VSYPPSVSWVAVLGTNLINGHNRPLVGGVFFIVVAVLGTNLINGHNCQPASSAPGGHVAVLGTNLINGHRNTGRSCLSDWKSLSLEPT